MSVQAEESFLLEEYSSDAPLKDLIGTSSSSSSSSDSFILEETDPLPDDLFDSVPSVYDRAFLALISQSEGNGAVFIERSTCKRRLYVFLFALFDYLTSNYFNFLLCAFPFAILAFFVPQWDPLAMFILSITSLIPLSWQLVPLSIAFTIFITQHWAKVQLVWCLEKDFHLERSPVVVDLLLGSLPDFVIVLIHDNIEAARSVVVGLILSRTLFSTAFGLIFNRTNDDDERLRSENSPLSRKPLETLSLVLLLLQIPLYSPSLFALAKISSGEGLVRLSRWISGVIVVAVVALFIYIFRHSRQFIIPSQYRIERAMRLPAVLATFFLTFAAFVAMAFIFSFSLIPSAQKYGMSYSFVGSMIVPLLTQTVSHIVAMRDANHNSFPSTVASNLTHSIVAILLQAVYCLLSWPIAAWQGFFNSLSLSIPFVFVFSAFASTLFLKLLLRGKSVDKLVGILLLFVYVALAIASFYHP